MSFSADFAISCAHFRLTAAERDAAWAVAHYKSGSPVPKAVRIYSTIANSLSLEELIAATKVSQNEARER